MRRNFVRVAAILGLTAVLSVNTFASTFKDVPSNHWAYTGISYMQEMGYMTKTSSGEFLPNEQVSYFDMAIILAKATGYVDENVDKNMDPVLKEQIRANYAKYAAKIEGYNSKYKLWERSANEEIAYLLGKGVIKESDLDKFVLKTATGTEVENILVKQDLATMVVRMIGREKTAIDTYTTTGFKDESSIKAENRPHVAYLKNNGIASGNSKGEFGANDKMTRAQVATMVHRAVVHKEQITPPKPPVVEDNKETTIDAKVNKVVVKEEGKSHYIVLDVEGKAKFYTATEETEIRDIKGNKATIADVKAGTEVKAVVGEKNKIDTIFALTIKEEVKDEAVTPQTQTYQGEIDRIGRNGDITVYTSKGSITYTVAEGAKITYDGKKITLEDLNEGDIVEIKVAENKITEVKVLEQFEEEDKEVEGQFVSFTQRVDEYTLVIKEEGKEKTYKLDKDVAVRRNGSRSDLAELRVGDDLTLKFEEDKVIGIEAESEEVEIKGTLKSVLLSMNPEITVTTKSGDKTIAITPDTEIYDSKSRDDITLRELMIGSQVEVIAESSEAISVIAKDVPSKITYKGTIKEVGSGARYIKVLVEYDTLTGETMVVKTINVPSEVKIIINNEESYRKKLEEGMEVLIQYNYGETMYPVSIEVID